MFFISIKEINSLISKGMANIYLKVTIKKNRHSQNFNFLNLKDSSSSRALTQANIMNFKIFCLNLKIIGMKAKLCLTKCVMKF